jgi:flagellar biogenesis protein FliO
MTEEALALQTTPIITFGYIMQVFISLLVVLAFIYVIGRFLLPRLKTTTTGKLIKILDRVYLEPQVAAYILKVGKSAWLIVTSSKQIARIDKIEEESSTPQ